MKRVLFFCLLVLSLTATSTALAAKPNIILIFIDDLGWADIGCYGNDFVDTPRIDRLAAEGLRFTDFYAAGAVCSPTRCAVQSGQNQARIGITAHIPGHWRPFERVITPQTTMALPLDTVTIAETLASSGYDSGYVGKWHLGNSSSFQPNSQGYSLSAVIAGPHLPGRFRVLDDSVRNPNSGEYRTEFESDICVDFINAHKDKPFFLMLSPFAVHIPLGAMSTKVTKYQQKRVDQNRQLPHPVYAAMIEHCDDMVGRLIDAVEDNGLTDNTMIIFTSDNGGLQRRYDYRESADDIVASMAPLKGEKGTLHEGGVRVPLIIKYPPLTRANTVCAEPTISYDFYPTFAELAGAKLPDNHPIDGLSLLPLLNAPNTRLKRDALHWHYPHYHHDRPASSIRERDWKLIEYLDGTGDVELYRLNIDLGETRNVKEMFPGRVADLTEKLAQWRTSVGARIPIVNPSYDVDRAGQWWSMRSGKPVDSDSRKRFPPTELAP
ncbi:sulfatase [Pirellulaceae bacterium]|jgi:uncharacterized sulfatase|nr:sulfatase [Pirellulaceae bacterium]